MSPEDARLFASRWITAWNAHDVEAVLAHFADDVTFTSPLAAVLVERSEGMIHGKEALRAYWRKGLERNPKLHFELLAAYSGIDMLVISYRDQNDRLNSEVLRFDGSLVMEGHATRLAQAT